MPTGDSFFNHLQHEFIGVERPAEPGFSIGNNRRPKVEAIFAAKQLNLIGSLERIVDAADDRRHAVRRVQALVGIHARSQVVVCRHLPAAQVDGSETGPGHLHSLVAGESAESVDIRLALQQAPEFAGHLIGNGVLDLHRAP